MASSRPTSAVEGSCAKATAHVLKCILSRFIFVFCENHLCMDKYCEKGTRLAVWTPNWGPDPLATSGESVPARHRRHG